MSPDLRCRICIARAVDERPTEGRREDIIDIIGRHVHRVEGGPYPKRDLCAPETTPDPVLSVTFTCYTSRCWPNSKSSQGGHMSEVLINLILQAIGGAIGGNAVGNTLKNMNLGPLWNTIAGAIGGAGGGSILSALIPALSAGGVDIGALAGQFVGGGVTGAIVTAIVGAIVNNMKAKA
jgi:hypothetical protein